MLMAVLVSCAAQRHQTFPDLAESLGVSYGYLAQLRSGLRPIEKASSYFIASAAKYLGIPRASALMLAELPLDGLKEEDLLEANELPADQVGYAMEAIAEDRIFGPLVTEELRNCPLEAKYAFVRHFEAQTGIQFLPERLDVPRFQAAVAELRAKREELRRQQDAGGARRPKA